MITQRDVEARSLLGERWAPVKGFSQTWVSTFGRVARQARGQDPVVIISKGVPTKGGYPRIVLTKNKTRHHKLVHRLVVDAFLGSVPPGKCVNHIDGNPGNSRLDNLEIVTFRENIQHAVATGLFTPQLPPHAREARQAPISRLPPRRLTVDEGAKAAERLKNGEAIAWIARDFGVGPWAVKSAIKRYEKTCRLSRTG